MRKFTLKPAALYIICVMIAIASAAATYLCWRYLRSYEILMYIAIAVFLSMAILFGVWLLPAYFRRTVIYLSSESVCVHTGLIFFRREQILLSSAQYVTRVSAPLADFSGFNFLIVHALGGNLLLPFLSSKDCDELERALLEGRVAEE